MIRRAARCAALGAALLLALGAPANASTTLLTPSLSTTNVDNYLDCRVVNLADAPITVLVELVDYNGAVILDDTIEVPARGVRSIDLQNTAMAAYCRFTGSFKKKAVRANIQVLDQYARTISAAPAQ